MIFQCIYSYQNGLEYKNADKKKQRDKETFNKSFFIHLTTY